MSGKILFFTSAFLLLALVLAAPAEEKPVEALKAEVESEDLATADKEDLKTAASHWGGHWGGYGGYGHGFGHYGGYYPSYSYGWGWPSYGYGYGGYGYWPYGGYGGHGYWW